MKIRTFFLIATVAGLASCTTPIPAPTPVTGESEDAVDKKVYDIKEVDVPPRARLQPQPIYPAKYVAAGSKGYAVIAFVIDRQGRTTDLQAVRATNAAFAEAAKTAVSQWVFLPAKKNGHPVACNVTQLIEFNVVN